MAKKYLFAAVALASFVFAGCALLQSPSANNGVVCNGRVEQIVKAPTCISCPDPAYPALAMQAGLEGEVTVEILIDENGIPQVAVVVKESGANAGFEYASLQAATASVFSPAETESGCRVSFLITKEYVFRLDR